MRRWGRPRNLIALCAGIAAGLLVWMLPPLCDWSMTLPKGSVLSEFSSDGRYLVTHVQSNKGGPTLVNVWDRIGNTQEPTITVTITAEGWETLLSPDGKTLAVITRHGVDHEVVLFDLASGQEIKTCKQPADHIFFSPAGDLYYVKDRVLRDLADGREIRRLPETIDGFTASHWLGDFGPYAIYSKQDKPFHGETMEVRIYSWLSGQEAARMTIPGSLMHVQALSRDGQVISAHGWAPGQSLWSAANFHVLADASSDLVTSSNRSDRFRELSPDGQYVVSHRPTERLPWLGKWWPVKQGDTTFHVTHWQTGADQAQFRNAVRVTFAPNSNQLAVMREDGVIEGYAWPLRKPWALLAAAVLSAAGAVWCVAWLWTRWGTPKKETTHG